MQPWLAAVLVTAAAWLAACDRVDWVTQNDWPPPAPALWEVRKEERTVAYLFGTIHALPPGLNWRSAALERALARSGVLVVEIARLSDASGRATAFDALSHTADLPPLPRRVPPASAPQIAALLDRAGMEAGDFTDTETWAAALVLASATRTGDSAAGVDRALIDEADNVFGLESHADQFARFDALSQGAQGQLLLGVAGDAGTDPAPRVEAWLTGDLAALEQLAMAPISASPELTAALVTRPNQVWLARIVALIEQDRTPFVAVGAGHMIGPGGLPALLSRRGYQVRRPDQDRRQARAAHPPVRLASRPSPR